MKKLCILIPTYKHPFHIEEQLGLMMEDITEYKIDVHIYDSSEDDRTLEMCKKYDSNVYYHKYISDDFTPDRKVYDAMKELLDNYEYIWLCGDGCILKIKEIQNATKEEFENKYDLMHFCIPGYNLQNVSGEKNYYTNGPDFAKNFVHSHTLYGATIYSSSLIRRMINNIDFAKYNQSGFFPQFSMLQVLDTNEKICVYIGEYYYDSKNKIKAVSGSYNGENLFKIWIKQWIYVTNMLPKQYDDVRNIIMTTESYGCGCFRFKRMFFARMRGCVSFKLLKKYWKQIPEVIVYSRAKLIFLCFIPKWCLRFVRFVFRKFGGKE